MTALTTLCPHCELEARVIRERREVPVGQRRVIIDDERMRCGECDEEFYTPEQADRRQRVALEQARLEDGLLSPRELKSIREQLGLTQRQFELVLGVGEKTVVRWESGRVCPNKATDRLIRLVAANHQNLQILAAINGVPIEHDRRPEYIFSAVSLGVWAGSDTRRVTLLGGTAEASPTHREEDRSAVLGALHKLDTRPIAPEEFLTSRRGRGSRATS